MKNGLILSLGVMTGLVTAFDGGMILANQMVGDKQYSEAEFQEYGEQQREEGYNEGLTVNVGYSEEDLQNAYEQGIAEMEEILSVVENKHVIYEMNSIEIFSSSNGTPGLFLHNRDTNKYSKIANGMDYSYASANNANKIIVYGVNGTEGYYIIDAVNVELEVAEELGYWDVSVDGTNNAFLRGKNIRYIDLNTLETTEILSGNVEHGEWMIYQIEENKYRIYSNIAENPGLYEFNTATKQMTTILTEGYTFEMYDIKLSDNENVFDAVSCALGICKINDDKTLTILLPTENGENWQFDGSVAYNSTSMYYWNNITAFEELELGVVPTQIVNLGYGYAVYNNEEKLVYVSPKFEVVTIETPGENIVLQLGLAYDFGKSELLTLAVNGVLYKINLTSSQIDVVKEFGDVSMDSILNGGINGEDFIFLNVFNYDDGLQDLYGYKNGELTLFAEDCFNIYCEDTNDTTGTFVCQTSDGEERIIIDYATFTIVE